MSEFHIEAWLAQTTPADYDEGSRAYGRYHRIMRALGSKYNFRLERVTAAFVSLSPNTDYLSNLRSLASVLEAIRECRTIDECQVSTYRHNLVRAWKYATGEADFVADSKGMKIRSFYFNVLDPNDPGHVTVDGHIVAIWRGQNLTMKQALVKNKREYYEIVAAMKRIALLGGLSPCQLQAILWFTRKRVLKIKHEAQLSLWASDEPSMLEPYARRSVQPADVDGARA